MREEVKYATKILELSEVNFQKETKLKAKFLICPLDEGNRNDIGIKKEDGEKYVNTLLGQPIVAKLIKKDDGTFDFGGHELKIKYEYDSKNGELIKKYYFDTQPLGNFTSVKIEKMEIDGEEKDVIIAEAFIWKRYEDHVKVLKRLYEEDNMQTSWEIQSVKSKKESNIKWLKEFYFIGVALLGSDKDPAYPISRVTELSEIDDAEEIETSELNNNLEDSELKNIISENEGGQTDMSENVKETMTASVTENDLHSKVRKAINDTDKNKYYYIARLYPYEYRAIACESWDKETEDDYVEFTFTVNSDDTISITSQRDVKMVFMPKETIENQLAEKDTQISELTKVKENLETELSEKNDGIVKISEELKEKEGIISEKETMISELTPYKEQVEKAEEEKRVMELSEKKEALKKTAVKGNYITIDELETPEIAELIDNLDEKSIKAIIAERVLANLETSEKDDNSGIEISEVKKPKVNINSTGDDGASSSDIISSFLR